MALVTTRTDPERREAFGWHSPGELRVFEPGERDAAVAWVSGAA
jgi:hypothetical protein